MNGAPEEHLKCDSTYGSQTALSSLWGLSWVMSQCNRQHRGSPIPRRLQESTVLQSKGLSRWNLTMKMISMTAAFITVAFSWCYNIALSVQLWWEWEVGGSFPFERDFLWIYTLFNDNFFLCLVWTGVEVLKAEKPFYSSVSDRCVQAQCKISGQILSPYT